MQPTSPSSLRLSAPDLAECRRLLSNGSKTFFAASFLLPRRVREPATALYAFCRIADDAIDQGQGLPDVLDELRARLDRAYAGQPAASGPDRAFAAAVHQFAIPRALPDALIEGFLWDAQERRYETLGDLEAYATRVAGTVGAMMALLMGTRKDVLLARACDLGIAMQLTNIARDVGEDARAGRIYLPLCWMRDAGIDPDQWLRAPVFSAELASVIKRLLAAADHYYTRSESGIAGLPRDCQAGIAAARYMYAEIGHELMRQGLDSVGQRAVVPAGRKIQLLAKAARRSLLTRGHLEAPPPMSAAYLVSAAASSGYAGNASNETLASPQWWNLGQRIVRVIELFDKLERMDREGRNRPASALQNTISAAGAPA